MNQQPGFMTMRCRRPSTRRARRARAHTTLGRVLAGVLACTLTSTAAVVPILDHDQARGPVLEREHDAGRCAWFHDHSICRLTSSNPSLSTGRVRIELATPGPARLPHATPEAPESRGRRLGYSSRAPPA